MSGVEVKRTHTALHVLKGAVVRVLGPRKPTSVYVAKESGRLTIEMDRKPTQEELSAIESAANKKVLENAEVLQFEMERGEAEGHFGTVIYGAFPGSGAQRLTIVRIPEWEVSCCSAEHVETTGEIGAIRLDGVRSAEPKGELEIDFHLER